MARCDDFVFHAHGVKPPCEPSDMADRNQLHPVLSKSSMQLTLQTVIQSYDIFKFFINVNTFAVPHRNTEMITGW